MPIVDCEKNTECRDLPLAILDVAAQLLMDIEQGGNGHCAHPRVYGRVFPSPLKVNGVFEELNPTQLQVLGGQEVRSITNISIWVLGWSSL